jgi:aldehyde:ferredoxin oxidoreductase
VNKTIKVNVKTGKVENGRIAEKYRIHGKRGLAARYIFDEVPPQCDPLGADNKLFVCTGVFAGTSFTPSGRISIGGKSPLTGTIKESSAGGTLGVFMARLGIKALIFEDIPAEGSEWKILFVDKDGNASLINASDYAGLGTYAVVEKAMGQYGKDISVATIGPAGEMLYRSASIMVSEFGAEGHPCRAAGRGGLGALMGSKKIKAIIIEKAAVKAAASYADKEKFAAAAKRFYEVANTCPRTARMRAVGSTTMLDVTVPLGFIPTRNFSGLPMTEEQKASFLSNDWLEAVNAYGGKTGIPCHPGCTTTCSNILHDKDGKFLTAGYEYETVAMLGPNIDVYDFFKIAKLDFICDDIGIDTIEAGCVMGVCMEAGKISWGDAEAVEALLDEMRLGTEFGRLLGAGTEIVGKELGVKRIPVVKGQGIPAYDPRGFKGNGITYAVSTQGADHTWGMLPNPALIDDEIPPLANTSSISTAVNSSFLCGFTSGPLALDTTIVTDLYSGLFGGEWTQEKLAEMAKETIKFERMFNEAAGFTAEDDRLPDFFKEPAKEGGLPPFPYSDEVVQKGINSIYAYK